MPKYFCDYCDTYLTHDSPSVRKSHLEGWKHKAAVRAYYAQFEQNAMQDLIEQKIRMHEMGVGGYPSQGMPPPPFPGPPMPPGHMGMPPPPFMGGMPPPPPGAFPHGMPPPPPPHMHHGGHPGPYPPPQQYHRN